MTFFSYFSILVYAVHLHGTVLYTVQCIFLRVPDRAVRGLVTTCTNNTVMASGIQYCTLSECTVYVSSTLVTTYSITYCTVYSTVP